MGAPLPTWRRKVRKKARRARSICVEVVAPLPLLPVTSLQLLASTCTFLHQLIHGRTITNLEFPFTPAFLQELTTALPIDKKPLLRLACHEANLPGTWRSRKVKLIAE